MTYHQAHSSADDTPLFFVVFNVDTSTKELNDNLVQVQNWALQWKMSFNPDLSKQVQEVIFSRKLKKTPHPPSTFNILCYVMYVMHSLFKVDL